MQYNNLILIAFGLGGILIHNLFKINTLLKGNTFKWADYFKYEWAAIAINVIIVLLAVMAKHEVKALERAGIALGFGFIAIGYMGQSIFVNLMGQAEKKIKQISE